MTPTDGITTASAPLTTLHQWTRRAARWTGQQRGWRRVTLALLCGVVAVAALPPYHLVGFLLPAFAVLIWLCDARQSWRGVFLDGWLFGIGFFAAGLYWVGLSFLVEADVYGWLAPFAVLGLALGLALLIGLVTLLAHIVGGTGRRRAWAWAAAWGLQEWSRNWLLTGFPWNPLASAWTFSETMIQSVALVGTFGLSLITVASFALVATAASAPTTEMARRQVLVALALLGVLVLGGGLRLALAKVEMVPDVRLRLVQASIPQHLKWRADLRRSNVQFQIHLSTQSAQGPTPTLPPTHIIWPETAVPYFLDEHPDIIADLASIVPANGLLLTGAVHRQTSHSGEHLIHNSLYALNKTGQTVARYDKFHLVPFGEYVPFRSWLNLEKLTAGRRDFSPGVGPVKVVFPGNLPPASPLICYEVIFPGRVVDEAATPRPEWLLNVTNDGWFGVSSGPYQHFSAARLRAVEEGLPVVRAANSGISAIIDPYGRVIASLGLEQVGVVDGPLPRPLMSMTAGQAGAFRWDFDAILILMTVLFLFYARKKRDC